MTDIKKTKKEGKDKGIIAFHLALLEDGVLEIGDPFPVDITLLIEQLKILSLEINKVPAMWTAGDVFPLLERFVDLAGRGNELLRAYEQNDNEQRFPLSDWQYEVENGNTRRGYDDWVEAKREEEDNGE